MWQVVKRRAGDGDGWWWNDRRQRLAFRGLAKAWGLLAIVGLLAVLAAACGGGGEPQAEDGDFAPCQALQALKAYRYSVSLELEAPEPEESPVVVPPPTPMSTPIIREFTGDFWLQYNIDASFVAPDRFEASISGVGNPFSMILIGDQAWTELEGRWRAVTQPQPLPYRPPVICEAVLPDLDLSQAEPQEEKVNDVESVHYSFSQVSSEHAWAGIYGAGSDLDILLKHIDVELWLAKKDNYPVRMEIHSSGFYGDGRVLRAQLLLDIRDANSGDIRVGPPS